MGWTAGWACGVVLPKTTLQPPCSHPTATPDTPDTPMKVAIVHLVQKISYLKFGGDGLDDFVADVSEFVASKDPLNGVADENSHFLIRMPHQRYDYGNDIRSAGIHM